MYTVVVLAALGGSVNLPDCGHRHGGCCGCYGGCYGCYGGCYGGWGGCYGCCGGCYGGCWGGCYGGHGGGRAWGGYSGTYGYAYSNSMPYSNGQMTVSGYYDPQSANLPTWSSVDRTNGRAVTSPEDRRGEGVYTNGPSSRATMEAPATILVSLPADAKLTIEGQPTTSTSGDRSLISPPLEPGKTYFYSMKAELDRKGQKVTTSQNVEVHAGQVSRVSLNFPVEDVQK
jgi:uncharacterized protein (TIGR03000 family)